MCRLITALLLSMALILWPASHSARAYTLQYRDASASVQIRWPGNTITVAFSSSLVSPPANIKSGSDLLGALRGALAHWSEAANIQFIEVASNAQSISPLGGSGDGISLITVAHTPENFAPFTGAASEMSARTRVFFTEAGNITEADIVLNPGQQFSSDGTPGTYDLEATFTHEIGHLLGLEHSGVMSATMQPRQGRNGIYNLNGFSPRTLSEDDRAGVRAVYGLRPGADARGALAGTISYVSGAPAAGLHVWAEEATTGRLAASNLTTTGGAYRIDGLLPGNYRLVVESLNGPVHLSEIASQNGVYAGLGLDRLQAIRTQELGLVGVAGGTTTTVNAQVPYEPPSINPSLVGMNGHLSTVAATLAAGNTYTMYVGGASVNTKQIPSTGISVTSPFISINPQSVSEQEFGGGLSVISFDVTVSEGAPAGDYSLRLQSASGEVAYIAGYLTVDAAGGDNQRGRRAPFVASAAAPEIAREALAAGSLAIVTGTDLAFEEMEATDADAEKYGVQLPTRLGATSISLTLSNGINVSAPLTFVSHERIGFQIPEDAAEGTALVEVLRDEEKVARTALRIARTEPLIFTAKPDGTGEALAFDVLTMMPAAFSFGSGAFKISGAHESLVIYGRGFRHASYSEALVSGQRLLVESVGAVEGLPGVDRIVIALPLDARLLAGAQDLSLIADGKESNRAQLNLSP